MTGRPLLPPAYLAGALVGIVALHLFLPIARVIAQPWNYLGILALVAGVALNLVADAAFKRHATTVKPFEQPSALVTNGVFRLSRNPMYVGFVLILGGVAILLGTVSPYVVVAAFAVVMDRRFIRAEEQALHGRFGAEWASYRSRVRRWI